MAVDNTTLEKLETDAYPGELAVLYRFVFLYIMLAGAWTVDALRRRRAASRPS